MSFLCNINIAGSESRKPSDGYCTKCTRILRPYSFNSLPLVDRKSMIERVNHLEKFNVSHEIEEERMCKIYIGVRVLYL